MEDNICVVIPAYNVAGTVAGVVEGALRHVPMVVVADDGSTDGTATKALQSGATVIRIDRNRGKGNALKVLFRQASAQGYSAVISMDGDGQHDPMEIPRLIEAHRQAPQRIIVGSRMHSRENIPRARYNSMHVARFFISLAANRFIEDTQCGFRLYPLDLIRRMTLTQNGYVTESEILIKAGDMGVGIDFVRIGAIYGEIRSHFRPILDVTAITTYIISYFPLKYFSEAILADKPFTYRRDNLRDKIAGNQIVDNLFKMITVVTVIPLTIVFLLLYVGLSKIVSNNFASVRRLGYGFYRITLATHLLPTILVIIIFEKLLSYTGIHCHLVDDFILKFYPHLWGKNMS